MVTVTALLSSIGKAAWCGLGSPTIVDLFKIGEVLLVLPRLYEKDNHPRSLIFFVRSNSCYPLSPSHSILKILVQTLSKMGLDKRICTRSRVRGDITALREETAQVQEPAMDSQPHIEDEQVC